MISENSEVTVYYDGECPLCAHLAGRLEARGLRTSSLQAAGRPLHEMQLETAAGNVLRAAAAAADLARRLPLTRPFAGVLRSPGVYRWIAAHRHAAPGRWLALALGPASALALWPRLPDWAFLWTFAAAIFFGFKWLTWWPLRHSASRRRSIGYLVAWPGMDARTFLTGRSEPPSIREWIAATSKTLFGAALLWGTPRLFAPWLAPWSALAGLAFLLHFGLFHLAALAWQTAGVAARPIMQAPLRAISPSEFWGRRWNLAFRELAHELVFRPVLRRWGPARATLAAFLGSGLVHELVISLPARAGFGLPTLYFLIQAAGVLAGHKSGRLFTILVVALPAPLLFHPPFMTRVIVPFLEAIRAL
jgi:predicted DCC family thiol-disulfide oxidoreductase YuxK